MANGVNQTSDLFDYLDWRGDLSFENVPVGEVDSLIFSLISYIDFADAIGEELIAGKKPAVLLNATRGYLKAQSGVIKSIGLILPREIITLLVRASKSARFGLTRPFCHVNRVCDQEQKQFSATSFMLPGGDIFVAFRGTDDTLVGWKENFNMSFMHPVPAQIDAVEYLEKIAGLTEGKIYVGGHSKGGNLAVYAAVKANSGVKKRIVAVYNNDGPGFDKDFIESDGYAEMRERIFTLVPQTSVVGMMLEHEERYSVVKSSSAGLLQHNGLSWSVMGGSFIRLDSVDEESRLIDRTLKEWLASISIEDRERFVDELYEVLTSTNAKTLSELNTDKRKIVKAWNSMDNEFRSQLMRGIGAITIKRNTKQQKVTENEE